MLNRLYSWFHSRFSRPDERGEYSSGIWQDMVRRKALEWSAEAEKKVLEVGCGEGLFLFQLKNKNPGLELWGVDNSGERIKQASGRIKDLGISLSVADATVLPFEDDFFDSAVCVNVFFNMPGKDLVKKALGQMKRTVKKGGTVIFDFRNAGNPLLKIKYGLAPYYDPTVRELPLKTYYMREIESMLKELGLEILQKDYIGRTAFFPAPIIMIKAAKI